MNTERKIKKISLIGLGAMGSFFAPRLEKAYGDGFRIIADGERKKRLETEGVTINGVNYKFPVVTPQTTDDVSDLILIGVKGYALDQAIEDIRNQVGEGTLILSLLNGVDSEEKLEAGKRTEIEMFAGTVIRMGKELGISTPINEVFYHSIRVLETKN